MSLGFKRVISSIMAFVMMVSTLVMVNVTGVIAADSSSVNVPVVVKGTDTSITAIQNDLASYADYFEIPIGDGKDTSITSKDGTYTGSIKISNGTASVSINGVTVDGVKANSKASNNVIKGLKAGDTVVFDLLWNSDSTGTMKFAASADGFSSAKDNGKSIDFPVVDPRASYQVSVTVTKDTDLYFYNDQQIAVKYIGIKSANQNEYTVSGTINGFSGTEFTLVAADGTTKYTAKNVTTSGFTVSSATPLTAGVYTVQADGYEDTTVTLATNGDNAFTFGSIAFEAAPTATITVTNSTGTTLENVYYWLNTNSGTARQTAADGVISNIDTSTISTIYVTAKGYKGQAVPVSAGSSTVKLEALTTTAISTGASSITPAIIETALDVTSTASYTNPIIVSADINGFKLNGEFLVQLGFDNSNKAIDTDRIQTSADSIIKYTPSSNGTLTINGASSSSNESAKGRGFTIVGEGLNENVDYNASTAAVDKTYELTAGTEYTITVVNGAINLYSISFAANASGTTTTTETTTEVTTTTATTTTEEPDTEESTEAPVTPGEGYVAMGSYDFNSSKISDTTGTYANMEFNLRQINDANVQLRGEAEGNFIRFKVASASNLTATFEYNALIMIGSDGSNVNLVSGVAVNLQADVIYTLRGEDGNNTYLSNLTFAAGHVTEGSTEGTTEGTTASEVETTGYKLSLNVEAGAGVTSSTDIGLKVNGTSVAAKTGETTDIVADLAENGTYVLTFTHPEHIYAWSDDLKTTLNSNTLTYTVPADISGDVTLELIYDTGKRYVEDDNENAPVGMQFGRYGIGDYKVSINDGNDALKYLDYKTLEFNLADIAAGRYNLDGASDTAGLPDQRLLLGNGNDQHITFKIETSETTDNVLVYLDVSGVDVTVSSENGSASLTSIDGKTVGNKLTGLRSGSGVKAMFYAKNGTYVITADAGNVPAAVKSIRIFQMDNKATDVVADIIDSNTAITNYEITDAAEGTVFARIIGTLNTKDSDELDGIEAIGVTFVDADSVDAYEVINGAYDPNTPTSGDTAVDVIGSQDVTTVYKGVYNAATYDSSKVDGDGYYTGDVDTRTPDGSNSYFEMLVYSAERRRVYAYTYTRYTDSDSVSYRMSGSDGQAVRTEIDFGTATAE